MSVHVSAPPTAKTSDKARQAGCHMALNMDKLLPCSLSWARSPCRGSATARSPPRRWRACRCCLGAGARRRKVAVCRRVIRAVEAVVEAINARGIHHTRRALAACREGCRLEGGHRRRRRLLRQRHMKRSRHLQGRRSAQCRLTDPDTVIVEALNKAGYVDWERAAVSFVLVPGVRIHDLHLARDQQAQPANDNGV